MHKRKINASYITVHMWNVLSICGYRMIKPTKRAQYLENPKSSSVLPLTVRQAKEVWAPTWKDTVPESFWVTLLSVSMCLLPSIRISFISLFCSGTSCSVH